MILADPARYLTDDRPRRCRDMPCRLPRLRACPAARRAGAAASRVPMPRRNRRPACAPPEASRPSPMQDSVPAAFHRARQGPHPSALPELPPRRRSSAPGRAGRLHQPPVERGADGFGSVSDALPDLPSAGEFRSRPDARPPGMAPRSLRDGAGRANRSARSASRSRTRPRNGGRSLADLIHHIGEDTLVGWAWAPGFGREPAPGTQKQAGALVEAWANSGAACPD